MLFEWDEAKNRINIQKHGVDFVDAAEMFAGPMLVQPDRRKEYGEVRYIGVGLVQGRTMVIVYTERKADHIRIISLRKANTREQTNYKKAIQDRLGSH